MIKKAKTYLFFSAILINAILTTQSCSNNNDKLIGEWKPSGEWVGSLILDKTNHAVFVFNNQVVGGDNFFTRGKTGECKYEIDYSKDPIWLDIVVSEKGKSEAGRLKGIVRFITDNKIEYRIGFDGERPDNFDSEDKQSTMVLDRVKN